MEVQVVVVVDIVILEVLELQGIPLLVPCLQLVDIKQDLVEAMGFGMLTVFMQQEVEVEALELQVGLLQEME